MKFEIDLPTEFKEVLKVVSGSNSSQNSWYTL
jgi:hypothetical protein